MNTLLITHTDLDGISPIILLNLIKEKFDFKSIEISDIEVEFEKLFASNIKEYDTVYICDLTVPASIYEKLDSLNINYYVFDHHASHAFASSNPRVTLVIDYNGKKTCASEIFYKYLLKTHKELDNPVIKDYIEQVRQLDTFTFESDKGRDLDIIREAIGRKKFIQSMVRRLKKVGDEFTFSAFEKRFTKLKKEEILRFMENKETKMFKCLIQGKKCGIVFSENNKSELGNFLSLRHPELDLIILIDASSRISYRTSKDDCPVNEFAEIYGGGGHPKASGSRFNDDNRKKIIEDYFGEVKELDSTEF